MPSAPEEQYLAQRMRDAGMRVTQPRVIVLGLLHEMGGHRSADDIIDLLRHRGSSLPRASVYNVLNDLASSGLVMRMDVGPGSAQFEASASWHHHFVCRDCNHILDVPCPAGSEPCIPPGLEGLVADEAQVIFRGSCPFVTKESAATLGAKPPCCRN